jgi:hypothetical protein
VRERELGNEREKLGEGRSSMGSGLGIGDKKVKVIMNDDNN